MGGPVAGLKMPVSIGGGTQPVWRADGKEIFYVAADGRMMSVSVDSSGASLKLTRPKPLFRTRLEPDSIWRQYDVSADGDRFLLAQPLEESTSVPITVIFNVAEDYLGDIQSQVLHGKTLAVDVFDRSVQKKLASGTLLTVDNQIDTSTGTVKLRAIFPNTDFALFPNQFVNARLLVQMLKGVRRAL